MGARSRVAVVVVSMAVAVAVLGMDLPGVPVSSAGAQEQPASAPDCSSNSDDTSIGSDMRCIGLKDLSTRNRLLAKCFDAKAFREGAVYERGECKNPSAFLGVEAVAQVRFLMRSSKGWGHSGEGVSPNVQWEPTYASGEGYVDSLQYNRDDPESSLDLVELKQVLWATSTAVDGARDQLQRYVDRIPRSDGRLVKQGDVTKDTDWYRIIVRNCDDYPDDPGVTRQIVIRRFDVEYGGSAGVLAVRNKAKDEVLPCPGSTKLPPDVVEEDLDDRRTDELPEADRRPDPADRVPIPIGPRGSDDDNDGDYDVPDSEFWDIITENFPEYVSERYLQPILNDIRDLPAEIDFETALAFAIVVGLLAAGVLAAGACFANPACLGLFAASVAAEGGFASMSAMAAVLFGSLAALLGWSAWGDPHLVTMDGLTYDLQAVGEFHLLEVPSLDADVQARFVGRGDQVSTLASTAFTLLDDTVEISGTALRVNGELVPTADGTFFDLGEGASILRSGSGWIVTWPGDGDRLMMIQRGASVGFHVPDSATDARGLLGNSNGDPADDLKYRDGTPLSVPASASTLHGSYANSWRIDDEESLFTYGPGQSTDDFTDLTFPSQILTLADFTAQEVEAAQTVCVDEGVLPGPQFEDCVFDVASTADESFAASAALVTEPLVDGTAHGFDSAGDLVEDFEGAVGSNFASTRYLDDAATTKIAGPVFDGSGYRLYTRDVGRHAAVDASMDVYAFGPVTSDSIDQNLDVKVVDAVVGSIDFDNPVPSFVGSIDGTLTFDAAGTTATGTAFKRYRLDLTIPHTQPGFDLSFAPAGFKGLFATSLGFDNIELQLDTPAAQVFSAALPVDVPSVDLPATEGAGVIEQVSGQDEFLFELESAGRVVLTHDSCLSGASYRLVRADTDDVVATAADCKDRVLGPYAAGEYRLEVTAPIAGTYSLDLYELPDPEEFAYTLDTVVSNGVPAAGAGNIERLGDVDRHTFSVPAGGKTVQFERLGSQRTMAIKNAANGEQVASFVDNTRVTLPEGNYYLETGWPTGGPGTYSFKLYEAPAPQTFAYSIGSVVSDGVPAAGAGNIERAGSVDRYTFSVPAGGKVLQFNPLGSLRRMVIRDAQSETAVAELIHDQQVSLPEGDYYLETGWPTGGSGIYSFELYEAPAPQVFSYSIGNVVSDGVPAAGAGSIEQNGSVDRFTFSIPAGGKVLQFNRLGAQRNMALKNAATGEQIAKFVDNRQLTLAQGDYYLETGWPTGGPGTYSFELYEVPGPQVFEYLLDSVVSNGVPAAGAGNIEQSGSVDRYTFSIPAGGKALQFNRLGSQRNMAIKNSGTGAQVATFVDNAQMTLPEGDYYLETGWPTGGPGTYSFNLYEVPAQQVFAYTLDTVVSNGVPAAGAGNIERIGSSDRYWFAIPAGGKALQFNRLGSQRNMAIKNAATGTQVATFVDNAQVTLPEGDYYLDTGWPTGGTGTYSFNLYEVPAQQVFAYTLDTVVSNGVPAAGAGNIERIGSSDRFTFSVPAGGMALQFNRLGSQRNMAIKNAATGTQVATFVDNAQVTLAEGDYFLDTGWPTGGTGTYSFNLYEVPAPQVFAYALGSVVSNGVPSAGAGNVERVGSVDRYTFSIPAGGQTLQFTRLGAQRNMNLKNAATGVQVVQMVNSRQITLPEGDYYLDTGWPTGGPGTYSFKLT